MGLKKMKNKNALSVSVIGLALSLFLFGIVLINPDVIMAANDNCDPNSCCIGCNKDYYLTNGGCTACPPNYHTSGPGTGGITRCKIDCQAGTHVATGGGQCVSCTGRTAKTQHGLFALNTSTCTGCTNKPVNSHYISNGTTVNPTNCDWACDNGFTIGQDGNSCICPANYYLDGNSCSPCPANSTSPAGSTSVDQCIPSDCPANKYLSGYECVNCPTSKYESPAGSTSKSQCTITCTGGNHVAPADSNCSICQTGYASYHHTVTGGSISYCNGCSGKPAHASYTGPGSGGLSSCPWACNTGFILSEDGNSCICPENHYLSGNTCVQCQGGYLSEPGTGGKDSCYKECDPGKHVITARGQCMDCPIGSGIGGYIQHATGTTSCCSCTNKPSIGAHYTSKGTSCADSGNCNWQCNSGYYLNYAQTGCVKCNTGYYTPGGSGQTSESACVTRCNTNQHVATTGGQCTGCTVGQTSAHSVMQGTTDDCAAIVCSVNQYYDSASNSCKQCATGYTSAAGSVGVSACKRSCPAGSRVAVANSGCELCGVGSGIAAHEYSQGSTGECDLCLKGPGKPAPANAIFTSYGTEDSPSNCEWKCPDNYYRQGDLCVQCPGGYSSASGSTLRSQCSIECSAGRYVSEPDGPCVKCSVGLTSEAHTVSGGNTSSCPICDVDNDFEDLDMYVITNTGAIGHSTLMDRNLGATAVYNGTDNINTYGCYFQWGNNFGFPNTGNVNTSTTRVNASGYGPNNPYSSGTFITASYYWDSSDNANLWGGTSNLVSDKQGPCPSGYHVPTKDEFVAMADGWKKAMNDTSTSQYNSIPGMTSQWAQDSLMPFAGDRGRTSDVDYQGSNGLYWSSIRDNQNNAYALLFNSYINPKHGLNRGSAHPVRCFKNTPNSILTVHPNGGTGAVITVQGGVIKKLGIPTKGELIFQGWYSNSTFTSQVQVGQYAPSDLYAKWGCDAGYVPDSNNHCITLQESLCGPYNPSNFEDLDMYFVTNTGALGHYTLMDRNLGATEVYDGPADLCTYGYYYQWGNNYGFPGTGVIKTSTTKVNASGYGPNNYYSSDTFINVSSSNWDIRWSSAQNNNLWGGVTNTNAARQGPCPSGYHVPSRDDFINIVDYYWKNSQDNRKGSRWAQDSLMPYAGNRDTNLSCNVSHVGYGYYWTSTHYDNNNSYMLYFNSFNSISAANAEGRPYYPRYYGQPVRCFKNTPNSNLNIYLSGGVGALIIKKGSVITKLGTPTKTGFTFGGWYSNSSFTSQVQVGQSNVSNLYAKWNPIQCQSGYYLNGNDCLQCPAGFKCPGDNNKYVCLTGEYSSVGSTSCTGCPFETTTSNTGATSVTQCYKTYTATFNKNGATSIGATSLSDTKYCISEMNCPNPTVTAPTITRPNWEVLGWDTNSNAESTTYVTGEQITLTQNMAYYAITKKEVVGTFRMSVGTTGQDSSGTCIIRNTGTGCTIAMIQAVCKAGYYGPTWNPSSFNGISVSQTAVATCTACPDGQTSPEGSLYQSQCTDDACPVNKYKSNGVCKQCPDGSVTASAGATSVTQCYKLYSVTFNPNGATSICRTNDTCKAYCTSESNCNPNSCTVSANCINRGNWVLLGWSTDSNATSATYGVNSQIQLSSANTTLYAITRQTCSAGRYSRSEGYACQCCGIGMCKASSSTVYNKQTNPNSCSSCTNAPENADYTSNCNTSCNSCSWSCKDGFVQYKDESGVHCGCPAGTYQEGEECLSCLKGYTSNTGEAKSIDQCFVNCTGGRLVNTKYETCKASCDNGFAIPDHVVYRGNTTSSLYPTYKCEKCTNAPANAYYTGPSNSTTSCPWGCKADYYRDEAKNMCLGCITSKGYHSVSGSVGECSCVVRCNSGYHVNGKAGACVTCATGDASIAHSVSGCNFGSECTACTNKPSNSVYSSYGTTLNPTNCEWKCNAGYYKNGNSCSKCPTNYTSDTGALSQSYCYRLPECGVANGEYYATQPLNGLCTIGTPSNVVEGFGMWTVGGRVCPVGKCDMKTVIGWSWDCVVTTPNSTYSVACMANKGMSCYGAPCSDDEVVHGSSLQCYNTSTVTCNSSLPTCQSRSQTRYCFNGEWKLGSAAASSTTSNFSSSYVYSSCQLARGGNSAYFLPGCPYGASCSPATIYPVINGSCTVATGYYWDFHTCRQGYRLNSQGNCEYVSSSSCFLPGTPVLTPDGSKNIEDIEEGDLVLSYDTFTKKYEYNKVLKKYVHEDSNDDVYKFVIDGDELEATFLHPFYVVGSANLPYQCNLPYRWKSAKNLVVGDQLLKSDGSVATIEEISYRPNHGTTYNLFVENTHTYFVGEGYLVHNVGNQPGGGQIKNDIGGQIFVGEVSCSCYGTTCCQMNGLDCIGSCSPCPQDCTQHPFWP